MLPRLLSLLGRALTRGGWITLTALLLMAAAQEPQLLNRATVAQLDSVPRVGPKLAAAIVARRDSLGGYTAWAQVDSVRGVGAKLLEALQQRFQIEGTRPAPGQSWIDWAQRHPCDSTYTRVVNGVARPC